MNAAVTEVSWGFPVHWLTWAGGEAAQGAGALARSLTSDPATVAGLQAAAVALEQDVLARDPGTASLALYAPERWGFRPVAAAELAVMGPPVSGPRTLEWCLDLARDATTSPAPGWGPHETAVAPTVLSSGEAVLAIADVPAGRWSRTVTRVWTWLVLPPGTDRTVRLRLHSQVPACFDEVGEISTAVADSVAVSLAATP